MQDKIDDSARCAAAATDDSKHCSCRWSEPSAYHMAGSVMMTRPALVQFWMNSAYPVLPTRIRLQSRKQQQDEQMLEYLNCWDANTRYQKWLQTLSKASAFSLSGERGGW